MYPEKEVNALKSTSHDTKGGLKTNNYCIWNPIKAGTCHLGAINSISENNNKYLLKFNLE